MAGSQEDDQNPAHRTVFWLQEDNRPLAIHLPRDIGNRPTLVSTIRSHGGAVDRHFAKCDVVVVDTQNLAAVAQARELFRAACDLPSPIPCVGHNWILDSVKAGVVQNTRNPAYEPITQLQALEAKEKQRKRKEELNDRRLLELMRQEAAKTPGVARSHDALKLPGVRYYTTEDRHNVLEHLMETKQSYGGLKVAGELTARYGRHSASSYQSYLRDNMEKGHNFRRLMEVYKATGVNPIALPPRLRVDKDRFVGEAIALRPAQKKVVARSGAHNGNGLDDDFEDADDPISSGTIPSSAVLVRESSTAPPRATLRGYHPHGVVDHLNEHLDQHRAQYERTLAQNREAIREESRPADENAFARNGDSHSQDVLPSEDSAIQYSSAQKDAIVQILALFLDSLVSESSEELETESQQALTDALAMAWSTGQLWSFFTEVVDDEDFDSHGLECSQNMQIHISRNLTTYLRAGVLRWLLETQATESELGATQTASQAAAGEPVAAEASRATLIAVADEMLVQALTAYEADEEEEEAGPDFRAAAFVEKSACPNPRTHTQGTNGSNVAITSGRAHSAALAASGTAVGAALHEVPCDPERSQNVALEGIRDTAADQPGLEVQSALVPGEPQDAEFSLDSAGVVDGAVGRPPRSDAEDEAVDVSAKELISAAIRKKFGDKVTRPYKEVRPKTALTAPSAGSNGSAAAPVNSARQGIPHATERPAGPELTQRVNGSPYAATEQTAGPSDLQQEHATSRVRQQIEEDDLYVDPLPQATEDAEALDPDASTGSRSEIPRDAASPLYNEPNDRRAAVSSQQEEPPASPPQTVRPSSKQVSSSSPRLTDRQRGKAASHRERSAANDDKRASPRNAEMGDAVIEASTLSRGATRDRREFIRREEVSELPRAPMTEAGSVFRDHMHYPHSRTHASVSRALSVRDDNNDDAIGGASRSRMWSDVERMKLRYQMDVIDLCKDFGLTSTSQLRPFSVAAGADLNRMRARLERHFDGLASEAGVDRETVVDIVREANGKLAKAEKLLQAFSRGAERSRQLEEDSRSFEISRGRIYDLDEVGNDYASSSRIHDLPRSERPSNRGSRSVAADWERRQDILPRQIASHEQDVRLSRVRQPPQDVGTRSPAGRNVTSPSFVHDSGSRHQAPRQAARRDSSEHMLRRTEAAGNDRKRSRASMQDEVDRHSSPDGAVHIVGDQSDEDDRQHRRRVRGGTPLMRPREYTESRPLVALSDEEERGRTRSSRRISTAVAGEGEHGRRTRATAMEEEEQVDRIDAAAVTPQRPRRESKRLRRL